MRPTTNRSRARSRTARLAAPISFVLLLGGLTAPAAAQYRTGPQQLPARTIVARVLPGGVLERSPDGGQSWEAVAGTPTRVLPAYRAGAPLPLTAFATPAASPDDPAARAAIGASPGAKRPGYHLVHDASPALAGVGGRLLVSRDRLVSWDEIDLEGVINRSTYITAIAVDPRDHGHWLVGTSYDGLYRTTDAGASWTDLTAARDRWPSYLGAGFFEEISGIWFTAFDSVVLRLGFGQGFLRVELDPLEVIRLLPLAEGPASYDAMASTLVSGGGYASAARYTAPGDTSTQGGGGGVAGTTSTLVDDSGAAGSESEPGGTALDAAARRVIAGDQTGIYLAPQNATMERLPDYFDYLDRHGLTSIVVDFKDDLGRLTYASELDTPRAAGAVTQLIEPRRLVEAAHARGFYVIARVVVFKDPRLWAYDNHRYALWDRRNDRPWAVYRTYTDEETGDQRTVQVEQWVDAYSPDVWQYNVDIAREIATFGVDEIQFDYIRFPSDGFTQDIRNRYYVEGADRVQALEGFLSAARSAIDLPISIDVFGFNAWARMSYLGQDITRLARYVDVISPMFYPSHFARPFLPQFGYLERAEVIYDAGTRRAREMTNTYAVVHAAREADVAVATPGRMSTANEGAGATLIRPYIQAFLIGWELEFEEPTYRRYLDLQVDASLRAEASGYTLWNASGRYYMLP